MVNSGWVRQLAFGVFASLVVGLGAGCAVGQRPGHGTTLHLQEPTTGARYWLYLPEEYVKNRDSRLTGKRWPLVVTLHGMKPFDNANPQIREWQQEADRYGFIVCAPQLKTPDLLYEFPFQRITPALRRDEEAVIAILDHLMTTTDLDPNAVLSTSWSSGGYLAHYMVNRHPDRFSCLAVRQSNFSADILDPVQVERHRDHKIAIFVTENDFAVCKRESRQAAQWYARHGIVPTFAMFSSLGHERTPSVAAAFFARTCGAKARTPPVELARMQVKELPLELDEAALLAAAPGPLEPGQESTAIPGGASPARTRPAEVTVAPSFYLNRPGADRRSLDRSPRTRPAGRHVRDAERGAGAEPGRRTRPSPTRIRTTPIPVGAPPPSNRGTPTRPAPRTPKVDTSPVRVRLSSTIGVAPLLVSYSTVLPGRMRRGAYFLWTDNGEPISNGIHGQKFLTQPGEHRLEVLVTTADGKEHQAGQTVIVLEPITRRRTGS